jgi:hypothetical protein
MVDGETDVRNLQPPGMSSGERFHEMSLRGKVGKWTIDCLLGQGEFGDVYKGEWRICVCGKCQGGQGLPWITRRGVTVCERVDRGPFSCFFFEAVEKWRA